MNFSNKKRRAFQPVLQMISYSANTNGVPNVSRWRAQ